MITVTGLTKYYDDVKAVDGINFSIAKGEIVGLLGPNGAGKSTTLRMLTCYLTPTSGDATIAGVSVNDDPIKVKKAIGYLPESAPLYADMVVYDYLAYIAEIQEVPKENVHARIKFVAQKCGLNEVIYKRISELSKGYKQRVGLAHAIVHDPEILILDEPTSGLDPNQIVEIRALIQALGREKTVILSTHILSEVEASASRVIIIANGRIVADDSAEHLIQGNTDAAFVLTLAGALPIDAVEETLRGVEGAVSVRARHENDATIVSVTSKTEIQDALYAKIRTTEWILRGMQREQQSLETIFQELTKEARS